MDKLAARVGDDHVCPHHHGGKVQPPGAPKILIGGSDRHAARVGDVCNCGLFTKDKIVKGAIPVRMSGQAAARVDDPTEHGGSIKEGVPSPNVLIGLAGKSGNILAGIRRCQAMAAGRNPPPNATGNGNPLFSHDLHQSYSNCGIESVRQIVQQATGSTISQEDLLHDAIPQFADAGTGPEALWNSGGSTASQQVGLLQSKGVDAETQAGTMENVESAVAQGQGVVAGVDCSKLGTWPGQAPGSWHSVVVTGVEYDADGNPVAVYINDTGKGQCGQRIDYAKFKDALAADAHHYIRPDGSEFDDPARSPANTVVVATPTIW